MRLISLLAARPPQNARGQRCKAPAVREWNVCRFHGARGGAPKGKANGAWKHGHYSQSGEGPSRSLAERAPNEAASLQEAPLRGRNMVAVSERYAERPEAPGRRRHLGTEKLDTDSGEAFRALEEVSGADADHLKDADVPA